jgi:RNA polymerase primary sigma factor
VRSDTGDAKSALFPGREVGALSKATPRPDAAKLPQLLLRWLAHATVESLEQQVLQGECCSGLPRRPTIRGWRPFGEGALRYAGPCFGEILHLMLDIYLRDIGRTPLLSAHEEQQLAHLVGRGDRAARDQMVRANLRLVVNIARSCHGKSLSMLDLISEGTLGLIRAVETFDPTRNTRFSTHASPWIRSAMQRAIAQLASPVKISTKTLVALRRWYRVESQLHIGLGRPPTAEEIGRTLAVSKKKMDTIQRALHVSRLTPPTGHRKSDHALEEIVVDKVAPSPATAVMDLDWKRHVLALIHQLPSREKAILEMRFGLNKERPKTLVEIGARLRLTHERIRQIESRTLRNLRGRLNRLGGT